MLVRFSHPEVGTVEAEIGATPLTVGRQGYADIGLADGRVSRQHGKIWRENDTVWYQDTGSSNGSWLDGQRLQEPVVLEPARTIVVGETALSIALDLSLQMHLPAEGQQPLAEVRHQAALYDFVQALLSSSGDQLIERANRTLRQTVPAAQRSLVLSWPPEEPPDGISLSLAHYAVARREALLLSDAQHDDNLGATAISQGIRSAIYVPLVTPHAEPVGVLCVDTPQRTVPFSPDDFQFVRAVGAMLATALVAERARDVQARRDAMAAFLRIASHDLRNPLTVVLVGARSLLRRRDDPEMVKDFAQSILDAGHRAMDLIHTYLELAALDAGQTMKLQREWVNVPQLVQAEIQFAQADHHNIEVRLEADRVHADPRRLRQVLGNLLSNALKYSPQHTTIQLKAQKENHTVTFHVRDQGVGISAADQARLFRQFQRVGNHQAEGIGLGLWLSAALVEAHGGRLWVESAPGQGSTFFFTIPAAASD